MKYWSLTLDLIKNVKQILQKKQQKKMKLYTAVIKEIKEQKVFSIYDIVNTLRKKVNNGEIVITDVSTITTETGKPVSEISRKDVGEIFEEIVVNKLFSFSKKWQITHFVYSLNDVENTTKPVNPPAPVTVQKTQPDPDKTLQKIKLYILNKKMLGENATVRGIHSSLKSKGLRVSDIIVLCEKNGFNVKRLTPTYKSEVL